MCPKSGYARTSSGAFATSSRAAARAFRIFAPRVVKETAYVEEECLVGGGKPDSVAQIHRLVAYLDLKRDARQLTRLWSDALPESAHPAHVLNRARDLTSALHGLIRFFETTAGAAVTLLPADLRSGLADADERSQWTREQATRGTDYGVLRRPSGRPPHVRLLHTAASCRILLSSR